MLRNKRHVDSGTAHVEPCDDVQNVDGFYHTEIDLTQRREGDFRMGAARCAPFPMSLWFRFLFLESFSLRCRWQCRLRFIIGLVTARTMPPFRPPFSQR
jgi:hypothetical protein